MNPAASASVALDVQAIQAQLSPAVRAALKAVYCFDCLASTNSWLLEQADSCFSVCIAEQQSAGRGRRGRVWQSPPGGNLYFSLRWCFADVPPHYGWLGLVVGLALAETLAVLGVQGHQLKWPNDVYHQGRKLGGILLQTAQPLQQVVIGIGLNGVMPAALSSTIEQAYCDLLELLGQPVDRNQLIAVLLEHLIPALQTFPSFSVVDFLPRWQAWDCLAGQAVTVQTGQERLEGQVQGLDAYGQLVLRLSDGSTRAFASAEVSVRACP